ncbi:hypothetical protein K2173_021108 [Erythroxylum novogranatense]|uniref:Pentatricopeptide repeat-containing protein n=1 Tax=Erythroxylum novogranatense TaxID=1862640 RepID=A0AAV8TQQ3_9ROSI|nr:hypothetical protein K2173_021108 [Erythroxylum novogranatense]
MILGIIAHLSFKLSSCNGQRRASMYLPRFRSFHASKHACQLLDKSSHTRYSSVHHSMLSSLRRKLPLQALQSFKKELQYGAACNIDEVTVALALKASCGNLVLGTQTHCFAICSGFTSYVPVSNSLMNMYCKSGHFSEAVCVFERLGDPDIVSWNTVLSGFQSSEDALSFARRMNSTGVVFDAVTCTTILAFCSTHKEFLFGLQLHASILKFGLDGEVYVGNALISMYSRCGFIVEAREVFEEMPKRDFVSWNAMISGYTQEGFYGVEAIRMFIDMFKEGLELDHVSFTSAVSACGHARNLEFGKQIHGLSIKRGCAKHVSVANVLISTYSKCEVIEDAKLAFRHMDERNVVSWTTMISIDDEEALSLFQRMRLDGIYPNDVTFISLIHVITMEDLVKEGKMVHGFCLKTGFSSESSVCSSLTTMYSKFKFMQDSLKVFEELNHREITAWNALISGYAQNGYYQEAMYIFFSAHTESEPNQYTFGSMLNAIATAEEISLRQGQRCHSQIIKLGLDMDPIVSGALLDMYAKRGSISESERVFSGMFQRSQLAWTTIISAYARHGDYQSVMSQFEDMEREGVKPDSITFLSVLTACGRKGTVDRGRLLFDSMIKDYNIEPSPEHYSCMVDMLGRAGRLEEAEQLLSRIPSQPSLSILQSLLGACRTHGDVEMGKRIADALMDVEPNQSGSYVLMSNLYAEKGQWEKVAELRKGMREKGVKKEVGLSWVDVGKIDDSLSLHGFSSGDKSHPKQEEICKMAKFLGLEMKGLRDRDTKNITLES